MIKRFLIPYCYLYESRILSLKKMINYCFDNIFFLFIPLFYFKINILLFILSNIVIMLSYEFGYMYNDTITIEKEKNPTIRLEQKKIVEIRKNIYKYFWLKKFFQIVMLAVLTYVYSHKFNFINSLIIIIILDCVYYLHNNNRNLINILTYFLLLMIRYNGAFFMLNLSKEEYYYILFYTFAIKVLKRTIEFLTKDRFKFFGARTIEKISDRRFTYTYFLFLFVLSICMKLELFYYFFLYQVIFITMIKNNKYIK